MTLYFKQCSRKLLSQMISSKNTWKFSLETRMMRRLWSLRLTRCEIHGQTGGIVGVTAIALVPIAISKQPVHLALRVEPPFSCIGIL